MTKKMVSFGCLFTVVVLICALFPNCVAYQEVTVDRISLSKLSTMFQGIRGRYSTQDYEFIEIIILAVIFITLISYDYLQTMSKEFPIYFVGKFLALFLYTMGYGMITLALRFLDNYG